MNLTMKKTATLHTAAMRRHRGQHGLSLIELMIALLLGLIVMGAVLALFLNVTRNNAELAKTNSQIENGRFAIQILQNDLMHAGYWGGHVPQFDDLTATVVPTDAPSTPLSTTVPEPCLAYSTPWVAAYINDIIGIPVQVYGGAPSTGTGCITNFSTNKQANTDVLVVRHAETCLPGVGNCEADTAGKLYFQASQCELESATPYVLSTTGFTLHKRNCVGTGSPAALPITAGDIADKRKFVSNIYYIRDYAVTAGDGIPTLMRSTFDLSGGALAYQAGQVMIEGIEGFHVELGIDSLSKTGAAVDYTAAVNWQDPTNKITATNRGNGVPDGAYVSCTSATPCTAAQLTNAVVAKIYVLARANTPTQGYTDSKTYNLGSVPLGPFNDGFKRHVFSTTVRLVNVSSRRETP